MEPTQTPQILDWLVVYWPILGGLLTTAGLGVLTLRDVRAIKVWVMYHRHAEDGSVYLSGDALVGRPGSSGP